jgi:hypothetical protein
MNKEEITKIVGGSTSDDFYYIQDFVKDDKTWKIYGRKLMENAIVLDAETFIPYKSLSPIEVEERIGISRIFWPTHGEIVKKFPSVILKGQTFKARACEALHEANITDGTMTTIPLETAAVGGDNKSIIKEITT